MNLADLKKKTIPQATFTFSEGMNGTLSYFSPEAVRRAIKASTIMASGVEKLDDDKYLAEIAKCIVSWEGFTLDRVALLLDIEVPEGQEHNLVSCTEENKFELLKHAWTFRPFIDEKSRVLAGFVAGKKEAQKKIS